MFTEYDRKQQNAERARLAARVTAAKIEATPAAELALSCDWDQELANLTAEPSDSADQQGWWDSLTPEQQEAYEDAIARRKAEREYGIAPTDGPPPSDLHKPSHGGYPS